MNSDLKKIWNREAKEYIDRSTDLADWPYGDAYLPNPGDKVLDAGCGTGNHLAMFRNRTEQLFGVDISPVMVEAARHFAECQVGDVCSLAYRNNSFDFVFSHVVISHCGHPEKGFSELARVCRPGGHVFMVIPNLWAALTLARTAAIALNRYSLGQCEHFSVRYIRRLCRRHKLDLLDFNVVNRDSNCSNILRQSVRLAVVGFDEILHRAIPKFWGELVCFKAVKQVG